MNKSVNTVISKSKYNAIIFDLDGVITQTAKVHAISWKKMFDEYLSSRDKDYKPFDIQHDYYEYVDGKPRYDGLQSFLVSRGIKLPKGIPDDSPQSETVCGLGNRKNQLFLEHLEREGVEVYKSTIDLIHKLKSKGFMVAVVSSSRNCNAVLNSANITDLFEVKIDGIDAQSLDLKGKPDPDIFLEAASRLGIEPGRSVVVEDAIAGVQAGRDGGFGLVIGVDRRDHAKALMEVGADFVVKDLKEVKIKIQVKDLPNAMECFDEIQDEIKNKSVAMFLDYDGTLTPIASRPEQAVLSKDMRKTLLRLVRECKVAVISGRDISDLKGQVAIDKIYYSGNDGLEIQGPQDLNLELDNAYRALPVLDEVQNILKEHLKDVKGIQVDRKKFSITVHYRSVDDRDIELVKEIVDEELNHYPELRRLDCKKVYELQPDIEWDKGWAYLWLKDTLKLDQPDVVTFYIGDDVSDEIVFDALTERDIGIIVGEGSTSTAAHYRLKDTDEVNYFLNSISAILEEESGWWYSYKGFNPEQEGLREALCTLGNGYFATRGAAPESKANAIHYPGTYLAGGYNRLTTEISGQIIENEDLVNLPNWLCLNFRINSEKWFDLKDLKILEYDQKLDLKRGVLFRIIRFRDKEGRISRLTNERLIHMGNMHLAALKTVLTPENWSGKVEIRSALDGKVINSGVKRYKGLNNKHLDPVETRDIDERTILLHMRTSQSKLDICLAERIEIFEEKKPVVTKRKLIKESDYIAQQFPVDIKNGTDLVIEKVISLYTSRDPAISECTLEGEKSVLERHRFSEVLETHSLAWDQLWRRFEIDFEFNETEYSSNIKRTLRLYIFHLLQTASIHSLDIDVGMPSRGWHGEAYRGHIFWDEIYIFPTLNYRLPQVTKTLLLYRYRRLREACRAARELGYKGAIYPWQSGSDGREESQEIHLNPKSGRWIPDNSRLQRHINAAIVYNIWQYYQVTGDLEFLSFYGAEMILAIASFWSSLAVYNPERDRYEIRGVMGPDEYHDSYPGAKSPGLNNNTYTNILAVYVLNKALELFNLLPKQEIEELRKKLDITLSEIYRWRDISRKMRVVFHDDGIISQFEGYEGLEELDWNGYRRKYGDIQRLDRLLEAEGDTPNRYKVSKQADVLMLFYLFSAEELKEMFTQLGYPFEYETIPKNINYYINRTSHGSSLSRMVHSWVLYRSDRKGSWKLFTEALMTDVADIQGGTTPEGIHLGAMAGCVDIVQRAYTGIEARGDILRFNPELPEELNRLSMHIRYRDHWLEVNITSDILELESLHGHAAPIKIEVKGKVFELAEGESREIALL